MLIKKSHCTKFLIRLFQFVLLMEAFSLVSAAPVLSSDFNNGVQGWQVDYGTAHRWRLNQQVDGSGNYYGMNNTWCISNSHQYTNNFAGSPAMSLVAGQKYVLSFQIRLQSLLTTRDVNVFLNTTRAQNGSEQSIFYKRYGSGEGTTWTNQTAEFTATTTGTHYLLIDAFLPDYRAVYVDDVLVEEAIPPQITLTAPANNSSTLEFATINLACNATDVDGTVSKVEYFANGNLIATSNIAPFSATWSGMMPGNYQITAKATDNRNLSATTAASAITVNFTDGTLDEYRHWKFNGDADNWTLAGGWKQFGGTLTSGNVESADYAASTPLYLFSGVTYKVEFFDDTGTNGRQLTLAYNTNPSIFGGKTDIATYTFASTDDFNIKRTATFTVPQDGRYYLMVYTTSQSAGSLGSTIDNLRIIGNMNSAPDVSLPTDLITTTVTGAYVTLAAAATDADGTVSKVDFVAGNTVFDTDTASPYEALWRPSAVADTTVSAVATDNNGGLGYSNNLTFKVKANAFDSSSLLGGSGHNDATRGMAIQADGTLVIAANIGDATPGGLVPILLNGANSTTNGAVLRLSPDGKTVLSVTRIADLVVDLDLDDGGNIYIAAMGQGAVKLNPQANALIWSNVPPNFTQRIDASSSGIAVVLTSNASDPDSQSKGNGATVVYDATGMQIGATSGASANTHDVAIHEPSQTIITVGHRNYNTFDGVNIYPVDVPGIKGYAYNGALKYLGYDWESDSASPRYLNKYDNNMADTRATRCSIGEDGKLYVAYTTAGGNHPLRYSPFDLQQRVPIIGGDNYFTLSFTNTEIHTFVGRYDPTNLTYLLGQDLTGRLPNGAGNTITPRNGEICADAMGRVYLTGAAAYGFPFTHDHFPGGYTGGAFLLVLSPDFSTREIGLHLSESGNAYCVAVRGDTVAFGGTCERKASGEVRYYSVDPIQPEMGGNKDGFYAVGNLSSYMQFQSGAHPRLFFTAADVAALRAKAATEPFASMKTAMIAQRFMADYPYQGPYNPGNDEDVGQRAKLAGFLWMLTGDEAYALEARQLVELLIDWNGGADWGNPSVKGLSLDWRGMIAAFVYDLCANSNTWDDGFNYYVSKKIKEQADIVADNGGSEQNTDPASNWQGIRGAAAGIMYLATDHKYDAAKLNNSHGKLLNYLNQNVGGGGASRGWNLEGLGYTYYPFGNYFGPYVDAMKRFDPSRDLSGHTGFKWAYWTALAPGVAAMDANLLGGVHPDFSDDNPHLLSEGMFGHGFLFAPQALQPGLKFCYDRITGSLSPFGARWDAPRAGTIWSYLYYPADLPAVNPMASSDWLRGFDDSATSGFMTYRNRYQDGNDTVAQFRAKFRNTVGSHDAPDALGVRIISNGVPFIVGGGRNNPGAKQLQSNLYPADPRTGTYTPNRNTATLVGTPSLLLNGGGHCVAEMTANNVGVAANKRWFLSNFDSAQTGADATFVIADQSTNGQYFQLATLGTNTVTFTGNTFLITGPNGASMKGTVLHPTSNFRFETGTQARGSEYGEVTENKYLEFQSDDGDYLVALTVVASGASHPAVNVSGTGIVNSVVTVGTKTFGMAANGVTYTIPPGVLTADDSASAGIGAAVLIDVLTNDMQQGGSALSLISNTNPSHGTVTVTSGKYTYTPAAGYSGPDQFTYTADNGTHTGTATVRITVSDVNSAPVAQADTVQATTGVPTAILVLQNDIDDGLPTILGELTIIEFTQPANGTLTQSGGQLIYTSNQGFAGGDSFSYTITDGALTSTANVAITVVNAPTAKLVAIDIGGSSALDDRPNNGYYWNPAAGTSPSGTSLKDKDAVATDIDISTSNPFGWTIPRGVNMMLNHDGHQIPASVSHSFVSDNFATATPARDGKAVIRISSAIQYVYKITLLSSNNDGNHANNVDLVRYNIGGTYQAATRSFTGGTTILHDSAKGAENWDAGSFTDIASTWDAESGKWVVILQHCYAHPTASGNVAPLNALILSASIPPPVNTAPTAVPDNASLFQNGSISIPVLANDSDDGNPSNPGVISISSFTQPANGSLIVSGTSLVYTPTGNYAGNDSFSYTVTDGLLSASAVVSLLVEAVDGNEFGNWMEGFSLAASPTGDPDHDSIPNAIEYVIGGRPGDRSDVNLLPTVSVVTADPDGNSVSESYLRFIFRRSEISRDDPKASIGVRWSTDLAGPWASAQGTPGIVTLLNEEGAVAGFDRVSVYIPRALGVDGKLWARLSVVLTE